MKQQSFSIGGQYSYDHEDVVITHADIALKMIKHFNPAGLILDPCRGDGAFFDNLKNPMFCELQQGIDFFSFHTPVDWIISNPPYSIYADWIRHSFTIAENIVYLIPINKAFNSSRMLKETYQYGGIAEIVHVGPGRSLGFPVGFAIGAVHYKRGYRGGIKYLHEFPPTKNPARGGA